jgi:uncharacterized protein (TIGR02217 family)
MSAFLIDAPFPDAVARGSTGGPGFLTDIVAMRSGKEQRNQNWAQARCEFNIATGIRTRAQMDAVIAHFRVVAGKAHSFPFKDWTDYRVANEDMVAITSTTFQLVKHYALGANVFVRPTTKPVSGTVVIKVNGSPVSPSIDYGTGIATFGSAPIATPKASFDFSVPVRYDTDKLPVQANAHDLLVVSQINLVEVTGE